MNHNLWYSESLYLKKSSRIKEAFTRKSDASRISKQLTAVMHSYIQVFSLLKAFLSSENQDKYSRYWWSCISKKTKKSLESVEKIKRICFSSSLSTIRESIWLQSIRFNILWPQIGETGNCRFHVLPISEISLTRLKKRKRRRIKINHNDFRQLGLLFHI